MKVSDAIAAFLARHVKHVFTVSGGADLHIIHSLAKRSDIKFICPQHEQSAGFQADAYARLTGMGCALATSGPGATNLVTAIAASWYDSIPVLYLCGNQTIARMDNHGTRGYGFQATPIVDIVRPITKWAKTLTSPVHVIAEMEQAVILAKSGRPGPVVCDLPDDLQRAEC